MTTGVGTPIAVFSLGLGPLVGAGIQGITAGVEAGSAIVPPLIEGVQAGIQAAAPLISGAEALASAAPGVIESAQAIGAPLAEVASAAPELFQGVQGLAEGAAPLTESAAPLIEGLSEAATATPEGIMAQLTGPQMSVQPPVTPSFAEGGPLIGSAGPGFSGGPSGATAGATYPSSSTTSTPWRDNPWVKRTAKGLKSFAKSASQLDDQPSGGQQQSNVQPVESTPPPTYAYRSSHVEDQRTFSENLMEDYLASGGAFYG